ncbi:TAP-like protein-domain-containing protein [Durotheca rogersii]|uniref:TAP-like protein-domain-containing protein n=1 Tax=Durotheca rogersii TaxID=419775 RepID=UPI002220BB12|nr:TAP-like protein-domain-containing protein [Durotheca rogersii]KAI5860691.1 TAP-like protein-domain-containing protein [Durotheca rogersii]
MARKLAVLGSVLAALSPCSTLAQTQVTDFDWGTVRPSRSLNYTDCYDNHRCAKLIVPLDWNSRHLGVYATIAIIVRPAVVDETDPSFGGTIIVNPGGPGRSGVEFLLENGAILQASASGGDSNSSDISRNYEIMSFDPRGVGQTTPSADCFGGDEFARAIAALERRAVGPLDAGRFVLDRQAGLFGAYGKRCAEEGVIPGHRNVRAYFSTASVARDMVEIVEEIEKKRGEAAAGQYRGRPRPQPRPVGVDTTPRIQYWGFSYGSILGNYFASMFPGRIGRMVLEAVGNVEDYYAATFLTNLNEAQILYERLWETCFDGGETCPLFEPEDTGPGSIKARVEAFLDDLDEQSVSYVESSSNGNNGVGFLSRNDVTAAILVGACAPLTGFPTVAKTIAEAMAGNFTALYATVGTPRAQDICPSSSPSPSQTRRYTWLDEALAAIMCGDGIQQSMSLDEFEVYIGQLKNQSKDFGGQWSERRFWCLSWRVRAAYNFGGPWRTDAADSTPIYGVPAAPLLFVTSALDPLTPQTGAWAMSEKHTGSRVLVQNSMGHGTLGTPGTCRDGYLARYFATGEIPPEGTVCEPDCFPFQPCPATEVAAHDVGWESSGQTPLLR